MSKFVLEFPSPLDFISPWSPLLLLTSLDVEGLVTSRVCRRVQFKRARSNS